MKSVLRGMYENLKKNRKRREEIGPLKRLFR
jgi:hypothetical protein